MEQCTAITRKRVRCKRSVVNGGQYCYQHNQHTPPSQSQPAPQPPPPPHSQTLHKLQVKIKLKLLPKKCDGWFDVLTHGQLEQIQEYMKQYDFNTPIHPPSSEEKMYPLFILENWGRYAVLDQFIGQPSINLNISNKFDNNILYLLLTFGYRCPWDLRQNIIKQILSRSDFDLQSPKIKQTLFGFLSDSQIDEHRFDCACLLLANQRVDINSPVSIYDKTGIIRKHVGQFLSDHLTIEPPEKILPVIRVLLSRNDVKIDKITNPHPLVIPYLKFYQIKQKIKNNHKKRSLQKPPTWSTWQKIAHKLQTPPLSQEEIKYLRESSQLIGYKNNQASPIALCVALARHYEDYRKKLTFNHQVSLLNETDLCDNPFSDMPLEYIIKDDDQYGFSIAEINQILKLNRHPYTGKAWDQVTVKGLPIMTYLRINPIDPIHLLHIMTNDTDEIPVHSDDHAAERLIEYYNYVTYPICQIYMDNQRCRNELMKDVGINFTGNPTFSDFVSNLIEYINYFPTQEMRTMARRRVYQSLELCQIYANWA